MNFNEIVLKYPAVFKMLDTIQDTHPKAIIAGGMLRDLHFNHPFKDVDIFINTFSAKSTNTTDYWERKLELLFPSTSPDNYIKDVTITDPEASKDGTGYEEMLISNVFEICWNGIQYNLIYIDLDDPIDYVNQFSVGISKIYTDGNILSQFLSFSKDVTNNTITLTEQHPTEARFRYVMDVYVKKLKQKSIFNNFEVDYSHVTIQEPEEEPNACTPVAVTPTKPLNHADKKWSFAVEEIDDIPY